MADHTIEVTVDVAKKPFAGVGVEPVVLRRGERGLTRIVAQLREAGRPLDATGYDATFRAYDASRKWLVEPATVDSTTLTYTVSSGLTGAVGEVSVAYFELARDGGSIATSTIPIYVLDSVDMSGPEAAEYQNAIDRLMEALREEQAAMDEAEAARADAEAGRVAAEEGRVAEESARAEAEDDRDAAERERRARELERQDAELARVQAELDRVQAELVRAAAELERVDAETERLLRFSDLLSQWESIRTQLNTFSTYVCKPGEFDPATGDVRLETGVGGTIYLTPKPLEEHGPSMDMAPAVDVLLEWIWVPEVSGIEGLGDQPAHFEYIGSTQVTVNAITPSQIDSVMADENPIDDDSYLSLSGVSNWWAKIKAWLAEKGAAARLAIARSLLTDLGSSEAASFDGSADVTPGVTGLLPLANGGLAQNLDTSNPSLATAQQAARDALGAASQDSVDSVESSLGTLSSTIGKAVLVRDFTGILPTGTNLTHISVNYTIPSGYSYAGVLNTYASGTAASSYGYKGSGNTVTVWAHSYSGNFSANTTMHVHILFIKASMLG